VELTLEQISAVAKVVASDLVPLADFSILGPRGRHLVGNSMTLPGRSNLTEPGCERNFIGHRLLITGGPVTGRVLRTVFLLLDIAPPELLDNYGELVRSFHLMYGPSAWFIIYTADVRMRSEHFDSLRRYAERDHDAAVKAGSPLSFDPAKPWHATFRRALADKLWWDENLHRPATPNPLIKKIFNSDEGILIFLFLRTCRKTRPGRVYLHFLQNKKIR
jgi:hypothetical protein